MLSFSKIVVNMVVIFSFCLTLLIEIWSRVVYFSINVGTLEFTLCCRSIFICIDNCCKHIIENIFNSLNLYRNKLNVYYVYYLLIELSRENKIIIKCNRLKEKPIYFNPFVTVTLNVWSWYIKYCMQDMLTNIKTTQKIYYYGCGVVYYWTVLQRRATIPLITLFLNARWF